MELFVLVWLVVITVVVLVEGAYICFLRVILKDVLDVVNRTLTNTGKIIRRVEDLEDLYYENVD